MPPFASIWRGVSRLVTHGCGGAALAALLVPGAVAAQGVQRGNCVLIWEPTTAETRSVSIREGDNAHVTHVSGGMLWTCGTATMRADSAVKYDLARRVDLIGNVRYRDTIRTLESRLLTYFELDDRVIATDSVHLTRLGDGSTLTGPRVEFLRAVSGIDEETIATGRPHMVLYPEGDDPGPPFDVDADRAIFAGEEEARAFGDVVITRPDLRAEADSATFRIPDGTGVLYGTPWVEAEEITLRGDTIRTGFEENVLRDVHALGRAHAQGESFEVRSQRIDVAVENEEVDAVWAHGEGMSEAISGDQHLYGDSLRFAMFEGRLDTINAVGRAAAIQRSGPASFDLQTATGAEAESGPEPAVEDSVRVAEPAVEDSMGVAEPAVEDSAAVRGGADDVSPQTRADSTSGAVADRPAGGSGPLLPTGDDANWVTGDTLFAIFKREHAAPSPAPPDSAPAAQILPEGPNTVPVRGDSAVAGAGEPSSVADPVLEQLTVIGNARSLYGQVRDSTATARPSRNYMIGARIDIFFRDGEPERVEGIDAIGLYLEPLEAQEGQTAGTGPILVPEDTAGVAGPDTTGVSQPPDSSRTPADGRWPNRQRATGFAPSGARPELPDRHPREPIRGTTSETAEARARRGRSRPPPSRIRR